MKWEHFRGLGLCAGAAMALSFAPLSPVRAEAPASGADVTGKTLYLAPNARLRYGPSLLSRVYSRSAGALELRGDGPCTTFNCPVVHNKVKLYARRARLDVQRPTTGLVITNRTLRPGDDGEDVRSLQEILVSKGYTSPVNGKYDRGTERAVLEFQRTAGLTADGVVGPQVRSQLEAALAAKPGIVAKAQDLKDTVKSKVQDVKEKVKDKIENKLGKVGVTIGVASIGRILRPGDSGDDVRVLQEALNTKGFNLKVDGTYGDGTKDAVREFQQRVGIPADGNAGPQTYAKLAG